MINPKFIEFRERTFADGTVKLQAKYDFYTEYYIDPLANTPVDEQVKLAKEDLKVLVYAHFYKEILEELLELRDLIDSSSHAYPDVIEGKFNSILQKCRKP